MTAQLLTALVVFVLASFVGFEVINKVPPTPHTPHPIPYFFNQ